MKKAPCIFCTVLENGQQKTTVRVHRGSIPVSIMLTLQTCFAGFVPTAGRLIVTLQAKTIVSDVGSLKAQSTVDVTVVNRTKPFFEFCIVTNSVVSTPGCRLGEIPFLPPAHIAFSGTLHLVDLVPGVLFAVVLDVPGVQLFQLVAGPCGRVAQLREQREKGVTAVPAAQPGTPKSGCMTLPEICTDNSGKIQKRR